MRTLSVPRASSPAPNTAARIVELLEDTVAPLVPCVPGGYNVPLLNSLRGSKLSPVVAKTETGAGFIADGIAWETGKIALAVGISGPGATNFATPMACAAHERNSVLFVTCNVPASLMGRRAVQDGSDLGLTSVARMTSALSALSATADNPAKALRAVRTALRVAHARRMPVHVDIALDALTAPAAAEEGRFAPSPFGGSVDSDALMEAARRLDLARRPVLLVGRGGRALGTALVALAETLQAPVLTTPSAKGVFPESHPLSAGVYSFAHGPLAHHAITVCDALLVIGSGLGEFASRNYSETFHEKMLIHVDDDQAEFGRNFSPTVAVRADAVQFVNSLLTLYEGRSKRRSWHAGPTGTLTAVGNRRPVAAGCLHPDTALEVVASTLPGDARVIVDIGSASALAIHHLRINPPQRLYLPLGYACVGHAISAAVGVRAASSAPTLVIAGDAAFMSGTELHTAVEQGLGGLVYVILNNGGNWMVESGIRAQFGPHHQIESGMFKQPIDIARMARGMGAQARVVRSVPELHKALRVGFDASQPFVIDLRVSRVPPPMADRIDFLKKAHANT
jgi:acetolactate synthase-1/2/3 large subunit